MQVAAATGTKTHLKEALVHVDGVCITGEVDDGPLLHCVGASHSRHLHKETSRADGRTVNSSKCLGHTSHQWAMGQPK